MSEIARCGTCGAPCPARPDAADGPYCSIHCEHYAGLARAAARAEP